MINTKNRHNNSINYDETLEMLVYASIAFIIFTIVQIPRSLIAFEVALFFRGLVTLTGIFIYFFSLRVNQLYIYKLTFREFTQKENYRLVRSMSILTAFYFTILYLTLNIAFWLFFSILMILQVSHLAFLIWCWRKRRFLLRQKILKQSFDKPTKHVNRFSLPYAQMRHFDQDGFPVEIQSVKNARYKSYFYLLVPIICVVVAEIIYLSVV